MSDIYSEIELERCKTWLEARLTGARFANVAAIKEEAAEHKFARRTLTAARKELGVATFSDASLHGGVAENWFWVIPKEAEQK